MAEIGQSGVLFFSVVVVVRLGLDGYVFVGFEGFVGMGRVPVV